MTKEQLSATEPKKRIKLSKRSKLFKTIINSIENKKAHDISILDLRKIEEAIADFFILCTVDSHIQGKAVMNEIQSKVKEECNEKPLSVDGESKQGWIAMDYFNVAVHIFEQEERELYQLEELWSDAE